MLDTFCVNDVSDNSCNKCFVYGIIMGCPAKCRFKDYKGIHFNKAKELTIDENQLFVYTENLMKEILDKYIDLLLPANNDQEVIKVDKWVLKKKAEMILESELLKNGYIYKV